MNTALKLIDLHAALVQALAAVLSSAIGACALLYTVRNLRALQKQTEASIAASIETFRPIVEVVGGEIGGLKSVITVKNKGSGAALNLRWRLNNNPERWSAYGNLLASGDERRLRVEGDPWKNGIILPMNQSRRRLNSVLLQNFYSRTSNR